MTVAYINNLISARGANMYIIYPFQPGGTYINMFVANRETQKWYTGGTPTSPEDQKPGGTNQGGGSESGGGSGSDNENENISGDLGIVANKIDKINDNLNKIENKIPTSGEIKENTKEAVEEANKSFWGDSEDINGEEQEEKIKEEINNLIEETKEELENNPIFRIIDQYENSIWGSFTGEEDFKIEWQDINYMNTALIPAGNVNFSKIARENEAIGNIKNLINIILSFTILMNLAIYIYNLILATLGIDNPYLYEKDMEIETTDTDTGEVKTKIKKVRMRK